MTCPSSLHSAWMTCPHDQHPLDLLVQPHLYSLSLSLSVFVQGRSHIFKIHAAKMSVEKDIRFELLARLCPNSTGKNPLPLPSRSFLIISLLFFPFLLLHPTLSSLTFSFLLSYLLFPFSSTWPPSSLAIFPLFKMKDVRARIPSWRQKLLRGQVDSHIVFSATDCM